MAFNPMVELLSLLKWSSKGVFRWTFLGSGLGQVSRVQGGRVDIGGVK